MVQARQTACSNSDVDVAVLHEITPPATLEGFDFRLQGQLEAYLRKRVDLVVLNRAPVDLIHRVLRDGVIVFERDPAARIRFEVKARNNYFDLLPVLSRYRRVSRGAKQ